MLWKITKSRVKDKKAIIDKIVAFNRVKLAISQDEPSHKLLNYSAKLDGELIGGINSILYFKLSILFINQLFVDEKYRHKRLGSALLEKVETQAKAHGSKLAHLDTFDWQAKDFYIKHGYEIFGILDDCPEGHKRYFMKKKL